MWISYRWRNITSNQKQIVEQSEFTYSPLGKHFGRQTKTIKDQGEKYLYFAKTLSNKCSQKLLNSTKNSTMDAIKTASKKAIIKKVESTGDTVGNKIVDKIKSHSKSLKNFFHKISKIEILKERYTSPEKDNKLLMNQD